MEQKNPLNDLIQNGMAKMREMVDTNTIVGQPIQTPDGVTLIPISRISMGFGGGGAAFGNKKEAAATDGNLGAGLGTGVKIDPVAFLVVKDGYVRVMPVALPAASTLDRVVDMVPDVVDKVSSLINHKKTEEQDIAPDDIV